MTDQNLSQPESEAMSDTTEGASRQTMRWLVIAIVVLFAFAIWSLLANKQQSAQYEMLQHAVTKNTRTLTKAKPQLKQLAGSLEQQQSSQQQLQNLEEQMSSSSQQLLTLQQSLLRDGRDDWVILDAAHRVELANMKLNFEDDPKTAARLLTVADEQLAKLGSPEFNAARQAISDDLLILHSIAPRDVEGALLKLQSLAKELTTLPFLDTKAAAETSASTSTIVAAPMEEGISWKQFFANSMDKLSDMVRIRKRETPLGPLFAPSQERLILQNMQLMLKEAELALLQGRANLYREQLTQCQVWLKTYFAADAQAVVAYEQELQQLARFDFTAYATDLSQSTAAMQSLVYEHFSAPANTKDK